MAKPRVLVELRPNVKLMDSHFEGYKLSLEPVPVHISVLPSSEFIQVMRGPDHLLPSGNQFSFLHTKLFGLQNKLLMDPWTENMYYIDEKWKVHSFDSQACVAGQFSEVWEIPSHHERQPDHFNLSVTFASPDLVVIADGAGTLHIVHSGDRSLSARRWEVLFSCEPIGEQKGFIILESKYYCGELHCLLLHIAEQEIEGSDGKKAKFVSVIDWISLEGELSQQSWAMKSIRQLRGEGSIDFAAFEPSCSAIFVASDLPLKFIHDSENPIIENNQPADVQAKPQTKFTWLQKDQDVTVWVPVAENITKSDIKVTVTPLFLQVAVNDEIVLDGPLPQRVDSDLTCWTLSSGKLEISISKAENGVIWPELIVGCQKGEEVMDPAFVEEVHQRLAHLCSESVEKAANDIAPGYNTQELEDCDAFPKDTSVLLRLDSKNHSISHQVNLGGHQWLFNVILSPDSPPAICIRHDVDACVWQVDEVNHDMDVWPISHVGTFLAFGYVQASKQRRKFTVCSPDMSYVAICDTSRHVYLYRKPSEVGSELRNRTTGRRVAQIAKQQLVQLESEAQIIGCQATDSCLYLLTEEAMYKLVLK